MRNAAPFWFKAIYYRFLKGEMSFWTLCEPLQDIVWDFCGDLRNPYTRRHKFVVLEMRLWSSLAPRPSDIGALKRQLGLVIGTAIKRYLQLSYEKAQRETLFCKRGTARPRSTLKTLSRWPSPDRRRVAHDRRIVRGRSSAI